MQAPGIPDDEADRLNMLEAMALLDTSGEERFDAVTRLAKRFFGVPMAVITLVDSDRQWFKSNQGLPVDETPCRVSFCGHAILSDQTLVIPDTRNDARFADNPLVTGAPGIRFYAGVPLVVGHHRVGTLCLLDSEPRELSSDDQASLEDFAGIVAREMAAREMASVDGLTGLNNRRALMMLADKVLRVAERNGEPATLVFLDANGLKAINDRYGHAAGDAAIQRIGAAMEATVRAADVIARYGGDEFMVLLYNTSAEQAPRVIERLEATLNRRDAPDTDANLPAITLAYGVITYDAQRHPTVASLIEEADSRMYADKTPRR